MFGRVIPKSIEATTNEAASARRRYAQLSDDITRIRRDLKNRKVTDPVAARALIAMKERQQKTMLKWMRDHYVEKSPPAAKSHRPITLRPAPMRPTIPKRSPMERSLIHRNRITEAAVRPPASPSLPTPVARPAPVTPKEAISVRKPTIPQVRLKPEPVRIPPSKLPAVVTNNTAKAKVQAELAKKAAHEKKLAEEAKARQMAERMKAEAKITAAKEAEAAAKARMAEAKVKAEAQIAKRKAAAVMKEVQFKNMKEHTARARVNLAPKMTNKMQLRLGNATYGMSAWQKHHKVTPKKQTAAGIREDIETFEQGQMMPDITNPQTRKQILTIARNTVAEFENMNKYANEQEARRALEAQIIPITNAYYASVRANPAALGALPRTIRKQKASVPNYSYRQLRAMQITEEAAKTAGKAQNNAEAESAQLAGMFPRLREATQRMVGR